MTVSTFTFQTLVQERLAVVEAQMQSQADGCHPDLAAALGQLIDSGGKRVRPIVALLAGGMFNAHSECLLCLAAAVELLHTATLVHDDLIDGALLRRGMSTINARWSPAATVLTGDFVFAKAAKLASQTQSVAVMSMFADTLSTIVNGEIGQHFDSRGLISRSDYYQRIYAKTASMFELAAGAAALLSPGSDEYAAPARKFGFEIGMAFQIMDDILDFTGEQATVGKPVASDLRQGLVTLPALYYLEKFPDDVDMKSVLNQNGYKEAKITRLVEEIRLSGAIEQSIKEAADYVNRALDILRGFPVSPERSALEELAWYIVRREV